MSEVYICVCDPYLRQVAIVEPKLKQKMTQYYSGIYPGRGRVKVFNSYEEWDVAQQQSDSERSKNYINRKETNSSLGLPLF